MHAGDGWAITGDMPVNRCASIQFARHLLSIPLRSHVDRPHVKLGLICDENAISSSIARRWKEAGMPASIPQLVALVILAMLPMNCRSREATLQEILSDPVVKAMMDADGVIPSP